MTEKATKVPRYVLALQDDVDLSCYHDCGESDVYKNLKTEAQQMAKSTARAVIIFDNKGPGIVYKISPKKKEEIEEQVEEVVKPKRKKKTREVLRKKP